MAEDREMRKQLKQAYQSKQWADRVDKMSKAQVLAVYLRLRQQKRV